MKYIQKGSEPDSFSAWKAQESSEWKPSYDDLSGSPKRALKQALMREQGFICCYCEREIVDADSHIEHFRPQHDPLTDPLDYQNLLCSCQQSLKRSEPRHCGNLKGDWFDDSLLLSPLDSRCEARLAYTADGRVHPAQSDDQAAVATISHLGLDCAKLQGLRKAAISPFLEEELTQTEFGLFVENYLRLDQTGHFQPFWTTIRHLFGSGVLS